MLVAYLGIQLFLVRWRRIAEWFRRDDSNHWILPAQELNCLQVTQTVSIVSRFGEIIEPVR